MTPTFRSPSAVFTFNFTPDKGFLQVFPEVPAHRLITFYREIVSLIDQTMGANAVTMVHQRNLRHDDISPSPPLSCFSALRKADATSATARCP